MPTSVPPASPPQPGNILTHLASLIRLRNQTGTLLLLLPSLWALVLASNGTPSARLIFIFALGALVMRSAGVIMNDLADQSFDRQVSRTQSRPLASGDLHSAHALLLLGGLLAIAVGLLGFLNQLTIWLSPIALGLAVVYPFTKRFFHVPQFFLGLAFGWGAVMAWAATRQQLDLSAWLLFAATICWALAYDTIYALQDRRDDLRVGVKSSAIFFGPYVWVAIGIFELVMVGLLAIAGWLENLNLSFYGGLAGVAGFLSQQVWHLREDVTPFEALRMFKQHAGVGICILAGIWLGTF